MSSELGIDGVGGSEESLGDDLERKEGTGEARTERKMVGGTCPPKTPRAPAGSQSSLERKLRYK